VPVDSKLSPDEQKILDEAIGNKKKAEAIKVANPPEEKKKKGFFKRLFGRK
jgi:penicillin-binding protein 1A